MTKNLELEILDVSDSIKRFSVTRTARYFSTSYVLLSVISIGLYCYYFFFKNGLDPNLYENIKTCAPLIGFHALFYFLRGGILVQESLIVLKDIGIQVEKKYLTGRKAIDAVDISKLKDIVIHEGLTPYDVRYFLGIIIKESDTLLIPFKEFDLKLDQMRQIFLKARPLIRNA